MSDEILLLRAAARLLKKMSVEKEAVLNPVERFGIARALGCAVHVPFLMTGDLASHLADILESMALQAECMAPIGKGTVR